MVAQPRMEKNGAFRGNFRSASRTARNIDAIVIHTAEGSYRGTISWFKNPKSKVSSHYVVSKTGAITEMVDPKDIAFTQTYYNGRAIGIECEGAALKESTWTPALLTSLTKLVAWLCGKYGVKADHPLGRRTQAAQFNRPGILGHSQLQFNKHDPGPHFPWEKFVAGVRRRLGQRSLPPSSSTPRTRTRTRTGPQPRRSTATSLSGFYTEHGIRVPSVAARKLIFARLGLGTAAVYRGTAAQNTRLLQALQKRGIAPRSDDDL